MTAEGNLLCLNTATTGIRTENNSLQDDINTLQAKMMFKRLKTLSVSSLYYVAECQ